MENRFQAERSAIEGGVKSPFQTLCSLVFKAFWHDPINFNLVKFPLKIWELEGFDNMNLGTFTINGKLEAGPQWKVFEKEFNHIFP